MDTFDSLDLVEPIRRAVAAENYETMTPIQAQAIPPLLEGRDVLGCAQTGTGKTAAFLLPILHHLATHPSQGRKPIRGLILTPTRELAAQIGDSFEAYGRFLDLRHVVIFGGVKQGAQVKALRRGVDVLVATPGRLLDLHGQGFINFDQVDFFVLDEADRMLDMGFIRDIRRVLEMLPRRRQNLLFSATMPDSIVKLASAFLHDPVRVEVDPQSTTVERIVQRVMFVNRPDKRRLLRELLKDAEVESAIVFTRTKHGANRVVKDLVKAGVAAAAIHGNKSQGARTRALNGFKSGEVRVLVATDIASRGIDVDGVSHIFNYDLPNISESYVHRIGRTGRAGREGIAVAFCDQTEAEYLRDIEKLIGMRIEVDEDHAWHDAAVMAEAARFARSQPKRGASRGRNGGGGRSRKGGGQGASGPRRKGGSSSRRRGGQRGESSSQKDRSGQSAQQRPNKGSGSVQGSRPSNPDGSSPPRRRRRKRLTRSD